MVTLRGAVYCTKRGTSIIRLYACVVRRVQVNYVLSAPVYPV